MECSAHPEPVEGTSQKNQSIHGTNHRVVPEVAGVTWTNVTAESAKTAEGLNLERISAVAGIPMEVSAHPEPVEGLRQKINHSELVG